MRLTVLVASKHQQFPDHDKECHVRSPLVRDWQHDRSLARILDGDALVVDRDS